jgi:hypothetical protein
MNEGTLDSMLERLRTIGTAAHESDPKTEPIKETEPTAPRNIFTLSDRQVEYIQGAKADIIERLYSGDDTAGTMLKAISIAAICLNDKAYYDQIQRIIAHVWSHGLGKLKALDDIPKEFVLAGIKRDYETIASRTAAGTIDRGALDDTQRASETMLRKGQAIYKTLPEESRASYKLFKPPEPTPPAADVSPWDE